MHPLPGGRGQAHEESHYHREVQPNLISVPVGLSLNAKDEASKVGLEGSRE